MKKVPEHVKKAMRGEIEEPQLAEIAAHFFQMAGGTRAFAKMLYDEYKHARPGTLIRQRILDMLLRVTKIANDQLGVRDQLGLLSDEDLDRELEASIVRLPSVNDEAGPKRDTESQAAKPQGPGAQGSAPGAVAG